jgi:hypothetical protein
MLVILAIQETKIKIIVIKGKPRKKLVRPHFKKQARHGGGHRCNPSYVGGFWSRLAWAKKIKRKNN